MPGYFNQKHKILLLIPWAFIGQTFWIQAVGGFEPQAPWNVVNRSTVQFIKLTSIKHNIEDSQLIVNPAMLTDASGKKSL